MSKHKITKTVASAVVASMLFANMAWAEEAKVSSMTSKFNDVAGTHWANKHISKLALEGILQGKDQGKFEPEASVTQEEVIIMAIRLMGLEEEAKAINTTSYVLPDQLQVSESAKPYMIEAIEKGLINTLEETAIAAKVTGKTWGTQSASREWVAKLTVRAIGKETDAKSLEGKATTFSDNKAISSWALGYINSAVELKIVDGMPDGSFKPKDSVTRAQMATFLSRGERNANIVSDKTAVGTISQVTSTSLKVTDSFGSIRTYTLSSDTLFFNGAKEDKKIAASDLRSGNEVYVVAEDGKASYVEIVSEQSQTETVEGVLNEIKLSEMKITVSQNGKLISIDLASNVSAVDKAGKGVSLGTLEQGTKIQVKRTGSNAKYTQIVVMEVPINKTAEGVIQSVNFEGKKLAVTEEGKNVEYTLADAVQFTETNGAVGDLSTLIANDKIRYRIVNSLVVSIEMVVKYQEPSDTGKLKFMETTGSNRQIMIIRDDNKPAAYTMLPEVDIVIPGSDFASIKDLEIGDQIKVTLDANNAVKRITILNRSVQTTYMNNFVSFDQDKKFLMVTDEEGKPQVYTLTDETLADVDGEKTPYYKVNNLFAKGKKIDLTASQDRVVESLKVSYYYDGTVSGYDPSAGHIVLLIGANQYVTLPLLSTTTVETSRDSSAALRTVTKGDKVRALVPTQDYVTQIQVKKSSAYRVTSKDNDARWVRFKDEYGTETEEKLNSTIPIERNGTTGLSVGDLPLGELVSINYRGRAIEKIVISSISRGKVTSVDAIGGKLIIQDNAGAEQTFTGAASAKVKLPSSAVGSLADLKINDRVELIKNPDGTYVIYAAQLLERSVQGYDPFKKTLGVKRATLDEQSSFEFHSSAYVHSGNDTIEANFLNENDTVKLYVIEGKVVELDKQ